MKCEGRNRVGGIKRNDASDAFLCRFIKRVEDMQIDKIIYRSNCQQIPKDG